MWDDPNSKQVPFVNWCEIIEHLSSQVKWSLCVSSNKIAVLFKTRILERSEEERERDQLRHERHKERERDRRISKAAPDKRYLKELD